MPAPLAKGPIAVARPLWGALDIAPIAALPIAEACALAEAAGLGAFRIPFPLAWPEYLVRRNQIRHATGLVLTELRNI